MKFPKAHMVGTFQSHTLEWDEHDNVMDLLETDEDGDILVYNKKQIDKWKKEHKEKLEKLKKKLEMDRERAWTLNKRPHEGLLLSKPVSDAIIFLEEIINDL